jgi:hypothetical protein
MSLLIRRTGCISGAALLRAPPIRIPSVSPPTRCGRTLGAIRTPTSASSCGAIIPRTRFHPTAGTDGTHRAPRPHHDWPRRRAPAMNSRRRIVIPPAASSGQLILEGDERSWNSPPTWPSRVPGGRVTRADGGARASAHQAAPRDKMGFGCRPRRCRITLDDRRHDAPRLSPRPAVPRRCPDWD